MITISDNKLRIGRWLFVGAIFILGVQVASAALENRKLNGTMQPLGDVSQHKISPDSQYVVYTADQDTDGAFELFSAPIDGSAPAVRISGLLPSGSSIYNFVISSDSQTVVYITAQDTVGINELYSAPILGGSSTKLNGSLVINGYVSSFQLTPDGKRVVYRATQDDDDANELYLVSINGGTATKLNQPLTPKGEVASLYRISSDSQYVVYMADQDVDQETELFSISLKNGTTEKLNSPLVTNGDVGGFLITPDSQRVVYLADQDVDEETELYVTPIYGGNVKQLNAPLPTAGDIVTFQLSPDGNTVIYGGYQDSLAFRELFSVPLSGGGIQKLNGTLQQEFGVDIIDFQISSDSQYIVFGADQTDSPNGIFELYSNHLNGGALTKLNGAVVAGGYIEYDAIQISPDSQYVVYEAAQQTVGRNELYAVPTLGGVVTKLNNSLAGTDGDVTYFKIRPDSSGVAYRANQEDAGIFEIFAASFTSSDVVKLSGSLVTDGDTTHNSFVFSPDGAGLVYKADQDIDEIQELYVTYDNARPSFSSSPVLTAEAGANYAYDIVATDPNVGQALTISAMIKPAWLNFMDDGNGIGRLRGQPTAAEIGQHFVTLMVTDDDGLTALQIFKITVDPANLFPEFLTFPVTKVAAGTKYFYAIAAEDPDSSDAVTLTATVKPAWLTFADNGGGTALLTGQPETSELGSHNVIIQLTDSDGAQVNQKFRVTVKLANQAPEFISAPILSAIEGSNYSYEIKTADADLSDTLTISATEKPAWLSFVDNGNGEAILSGTPGASDVGIHDVQIEVVDSKSDVDVQTFQVEVQGSSIGAVVFSSSPDLIGKGGEAYRFDITTDFTGNSQDLVITAPVKPEWLSLVDNGDGTAALSGTPTAADVGNHSVELLVSDGMALEAMQSFVITVISDESEPPIEDGFIIFLPLIVR